MTPMLERYFSEKIEKVVNLIDGYDLHYHAIGVFGSFARGECKMTSDVDICVIIDEKPEAHVSGTLREEADIIGADIVFVSPKSFYESELLLHKNIRRDFKFLKGDRSYDILSDRNK